MKLESKFQSELIKELHRRLPGCFIIKNDSGHTQGILDLSILYGPWWAMLEVKRSAKANVQPNQPYYVDKFNKMGFAAFIYPENMTEILDELQIYFGELERNTRFPDS